MTTAAQITVHPPREVPLGGVRAMSVRRTLPSRERSFIGAWCFVDHYGPDRVADTGGMDVAPHPHTELQTVTWLFEGEVEHRDSGGAHGMVRPGEVNLMTAGRGICHSEVSTPGTQVLHGVQLWVVLPEHAKHSERRFEHYEPPTVRLPAGTVRVFLGELAGSASPVRTHTPLLGAEVHLAAGASWPVEVDPGFEHGVLVDAGTITLDGVPVAADELATVEAGPARLTLTNTGDAAARLVLLGGEPFEESVVMWWNFIGRTHDDIVAYRQEWNERSEHFGRVAGYDDEDTWLRAPELPHVRLKSRNRLGRLT